MQFVVLPMFFLSGAIFPLSRLPGWLAVLTRLDPLTYGVDPMRRAVFAHVAATSKVKQALDPGDPLGRLAPARRRSSCSSSPRSGR